MSNHLIVNNEVLIHFNSFYHISYQRNRIEGKAKQFDAKVQAWTFQFKLLNILNPKLPNISISFKTLQTSFFGGKIKANESQTKFH